MSTGSLSIPIELLCDGNKISMDLRNDLIDCGIDICSPEVLVLMSDNFDYQDLRSHFVSNEVHNIELGNKIMAYVMDNDEYGMRVSDFRTYAAASRDIMLRWMYPMVPENLPGPQAQDGFVRGGSGMRYERGSIYRHYSVTLPRSTYVGRCSTICCNVKVGENCRVEGSVLGIGTVLGEGTSVTNSFLWGAVVGKGSAIDHAVVAEGVVIGNGVTVSRGCVLGKGVIVEPGVTLPAFTRLTISPGFLPPLALSHHFFSTDVLLFPADELLVFGSPLLLNRCFRGELIGTWQAQFFGCRDRIRSSGR